MAVRTNGIRNPGPRTSSLTGWASGFGTSEVINASWVGTAGAAPEGRTGFYRRTVTTAKTGGQSLAYFTSTAGDVSGGAGTVRTFSLWVRHSVAVTGAWMSAQFKNGATLVNYTDGTPVNIPANTWTRLAVTSTAAGTFNTVVLYAVTPAGAVIPVGGTYDTADAMTELGVTLGTYFDGASASTGNITHSWAGAANASLSLEYPTPGLWTTALDMSVPAVGVAVDGLSNSGPSRVTVWRMTAGGQRRKVRGWDARQVYGSDYLIDYEAPLGRPITYQLEVNSGSTIPGRLTDTATLTVAAGVIQDPLQPLTGVEVSTDDVTFGPMVTNAAFRKITYDVESTKVTILGGREPVALTGQRMAASGIDFSMATESQEQTDRLRNLLGYASVVLVRPLPEWGPLPDLIYTVPSVVEEPIYGEDGAVMTTWRLSGDSVRAPSINILVALWTYDAVKARRTTYSAEQAVATAGGLRYLDVQVDPSMGV